MTIFKLHLDYQEGIIVNQPELFEHFFSIHSLRINAFHMIRDNLNNTQQNCLTFIEGLFEASKPYLAKQSPFHSSPLTPIQILLGLGLGLPSPK